jgi:hypothetical protein
LNAQSPGFTVGDDSDAPLAPCGRVNNIRFKMINPTTVNLTWDAVPGSTYYYVQAYPWRTTVTPPFGYSRTNNSFTLDYSTAPWIYGDITATYAIMEISVHAVCAGGPNDLGPTNSGGFALAPIRELCAFFPSPSDYNIDVNPSPGNIFRYQLALANWQNSTRLLFP